MLLETWSDVLSRSFQELWVGLIKGFLPNFLAAVIIFILGWIVGALLGRVVAQIIRSLKVDKALRGAGIEDVLRRANISLDSGAFIGGLVKWFVIVAFLLASLDVLNLTEVNNFLSEVVLGYLPQVIVAVLILLAAALIAEAMQHVVVSSAKAAEIKAAHLLGTVTRWSIWVFALLAALSQLKIAPAFMQTLFTGIVIAFSLAVGLAFGLGGQEAAARYIERVRDEIAHK